MAALTPSPALTVRNLILILGGNSSSPASFEANAAPADCYLLEMTLLEMTLHGGVQVQMIQLHTSSYCRAVHDNHLRGVQG
jgi:hypothetical protein